MERMESAWTAKRKIPTLRASSGRTNPRTLKRQKLMEESPGTKEDPIYLSMFDWC